MRTIQTSLILTALAAVHANLDRDSLDAELEAGNVAREYHNCCEALLSAENPRDAVVRRKIDTSLVRARKAHENYGIAVARSIAIQEITQLVSDDPLTVLSGQVDEPSSIEEEALRILFLENDVISLARAAIVDSYQSFPSTADLAVQAAWAKFGTHYRSVFGLIAIELTRAGVPGVSCFHLTEEMENAWPRLNADRMADIFRSRG